jgi:adenylate cyclase
MIANNTIRLAIEMAAPKDALAGLRRRIRAPLHQIISYAEMMSEEADNAPGEFGRCINDILGLCEMILRHATKFVPTTGDSGESLAGLRQHLAQQSAAMAAFCERLLNLCSAEPLHVFLEDAGKLRNAVQVFESVLSEMAAQVQPIGRTACIPALPVAALGKKSSSSGASAGKCKTRAPLGGVILIVDDNEGNRDVLSRRLLRDGSEVMLAESGQQALRMARRYEFDLILLDIMMPEMDGFTVLTEIRRDPRLRHLPVIMISAIDEIESVVRCIELGADDYLMKPFNPVLLRARISALLERKQLRDIELQRTEQLQIALNETQKHREKTEQLLLNILPASVAEELQSQGSVQPMYFEDVTILFADFAGFTLSTEQLPAEDLVQVLHNYFTAFDNIMRRYNLEKLKTIGDCYMFAGGLPERNPSHPVDAILAAFEMLQVTDGMAKEGPVNWNLRIGAHTGPVVAGVVGIHKFGFDVWGETVNFASRMESSGAPGRINISPSTYQRVKDFFAVENRGKVRTKDGREVDMYFASGLAASLLSHKKFSPVESFAQRYQTYFRKLPAAMPDIISRSPSA